MPVPKTSNRLPSPGRPRPIGSDFVCGICAGSGLDVLISAVPTSTTSGRSGRCHDLDTNPTAGWRVERPRSGCRSGGACGWSDISRPAASLFESVLRFLAGLLQVGLGLLALALTGPGGVIGCLPCRFFGLALHLLGSV